MKKIWREAATITFQIDEKPEEKPDGTARAVQTGKAAEISDGDFTCYVFGI